MAKYQIEIPDGVIPEGYEPVEFRHLKNSEYFITSAGKDAKYITNVQDIIDGPRIVLRKAWQWPAWLNAEKIEWSGNTWWMVSGSESKCFTENTWRSFFNCEPPPDKTKVYHNPNKVKP